MKKSIIFSAVALLASITSAQAVETQNGSERLYRFDFQCEFARENAPTVQNDDHSKEFAAVARVFANVRRDRDSQMTENLFDNASQARDLRNLMAVARNGNLFYSDGANLFSGRREVVIAAASGQRLAIVIPRRDHDAPTVEFSNYRSFLVLGEARIPGNCQVRARAIQQGHEYDEENQDMVTIPANPATPATTAPAPTLN